MIDSLKKLFWKKFMWTWRFWMLVGIVGCVSGLYFQRLAGNGLGLWFLGLVFSRAQLTSSGPTGG